MCVVIEPPGAGQLVLDVRTVPEGVDLRVALRPQEFVNDDALVLRDLGAEGRTKPRGKKYSGLNFAIGTCLLYCVMMRLVWVT